MFLGLSLWDTLYYVTTTFFQVPKTRILNNIRNASLLVCSHYIRKYDTITLCVWSSFLDYSFVVHLCNILKYWHYSYVSFSFVIATSFYYVTIRYLFVQIISFFDDVRITLNCGNCWNVWIVYGSYVIKWSYFSYIVF